VLGGAGATVDGYKRAPDAGSVYAHSRSRVTIYLRITEKLCSSHLPTLFSVALPVWADASFSDLTFSLRLRHGPVTPLPNSKIKHATLCLRCAFYPRVAHYGTSRTSAVPPRSQLRRYNIRLLPTSNICARPLSLWKIWLVSKCALEGTREQSLVCSSWVVGAFWGAAVGIGPVEAHIHPRNYIRGCVTSTH
jgi:hypothetical protein